MTRSHSSHALGDLTESLLRAALAAGADAADALAVAGASVSIDVRDGALEGAERSEGTDLGLRVLVGQRQAMTSASDLSQDTIEIMAARAVAMAREAPEDPHLGLAPPDLLAQDLDATALELQDTSDEPTPEHLRDMALRCEAAARDVPGVSQVEGASAGFGHRALHLATTEGFSAGYGRSSVSVSCSAISGSGTTMERDYDGDSRVFATDLRAPEEIGRVAGERAAALRGARRPATGACPVLFDERISSSLIGHLVQAANGMMIARGSSWLRDGIGRQVLPEGLSLVEDPLRPRVAGSRPFDGEGLPARRRSIVEDGRLISYSLDLATARKLGMAPTGSAARSVGGAPHPAVTNLTLTQSDRSRADLIADMGTGLLVTSLIGSTINPNTGDYSRGASGFWVEDGEIAYPVNEVTIAGSLPDFLPRIIPANDARPWLSRVVPSLLVEGLTLAGA